MRGGSSVGDGNYPHRILIVADEGIARDAYRKVATRLSELADGLKQRHCDVEIALLRGDADVVAALRERGHAAHPVGWDAYRHTPRAVRRLVHLLGSGSFDIVMGREVIPAIISGAAARLSRSPVTSQFVRCHTHGRLALNWTSFVAANVSHQVLAISEAVARCSLRLDRIDPRRVRVITQGRSAMRQPSDLELLKARQQAGIKGSAPVLVVVARLRNEKGVD
ncbi:MAG: glycosyltransferase, partial [Actinomycetota bacterium]